MKSFFTLVFALLACAQMSHSQSASTTNCENFTASYSTTESRCAATGTITITAAGGSGDYSYKILEPFTTPLTSTAVLSGLPPGTYTVLTRDMTTGCTIVEENIVVAGSYSDPRFQLVKTDLTCTGSNDGSISVSNQQFGRAPLDYTIVAPSPAAIGTSNNTGVFTGLPAGYYYIQLRDSCGGIQTRSISVLDYTWVINTKTVTRVNCNTLAVSVSLLDNKGNTNLSGTAFTGFRYGAVASPGDTTWYSNRNFNFTATKLRTIQFVVKDRCGRIESFSWSNPVPAMGNNVTTGSFSCNMFSASATGTANLNNQAFYLMQGSTLIQSNTNGNFSYIPYGSYCIVMREPCYDTTITTCFTVKAPVPAAAALVTQSAQTCSTFTASVTGMTNIFYPSYSIYTASNVFVANSSNGTFPNLPYGDYCIRIVSGSPCYDTTIQRCFTAVQPRPVVPAVTTNNITCAGFDASISGTFLSNPNFCLYNTITNTLIGCNNTGTFPGLTFGQYCIRVTTQAPCYDTTIERCFIVNQPQPSTGNPVITGRDCNGFTVTIPSVSNIQNPEYCLFGSGNTPMGCNTTGIFTGLAYGSYSIVTTSTLSGGACPVIPVTRNFSVTKDVPGADITVATSNRACATFSADITGEVNLFNPRYYLVDLANNPIANNNTGTFHNIAYGSYKIIIRDDCPATYLERPVTLNAIPVAFTVTASESCTFTTTNIAINVNAGIAPYQVRVLNPMNVVVATYTFSTPAYTLSDLPALGSGLDYRIAVTSACGETQTISVTPKASLFSRTSSVSSKCPSAAWENGSGEIFTELVSNIGMYNPTIIKRNGVAMSMTPTLVQNISANHRRYTFSDMSPATYILEYNLTGCTRIVTDTIVVTNYLYPNLLNSAAYQCDNNNFSVNAVASNGVAPFTYEIIGSNGSGPAIVSPMQLNSVFNISTNDNYSLVRMRAVDACGNGTLNDVSVLPLGNLTIQVNNVDCYSNNITLSVDTIPNATYAWYKKTTLEDSVLIGTSQSYNIPSLFPTHTGMYVCKTIVNNGCLVRLSYYHLRGGCSIVLPVKVLSFEGKLENAQVPLKWKVTEEKSVRHYQVERKTGSGSFALIGTVKAANKGADASYSLTDQDPGTGVLQYRLKITGEDGLVTYSNIISIQRDGVEIIAGPNPVKDDLRIQIYGKEETVYDIILVSLSGQTVYSQATTRLRSGTVQIQRNGKINAGMYILKIRNQNSGYLFTKKMLFE